MQIHQHKKTFRRNLHVGCSVLFCQATLPFAQLEPVLFEKTDCGYGFCGRAISIFFLCPM